MSPKPRNHQRWGSGVAGVQGEAFIGIVRRNRGARGRASSTGAARCWRPPSRRSRSGTNPGDIVEQSSEDIWQACAATIRTAMAEAGLKPADIGGIGFDATCSLVVLGDNAQPLTVSPSGDSQRNIIVWMDHRAIAQARAHQQDRPRGAALCRRHHLAGNGDAEDPLAEGAPAGDLQRRAGILRPRRLSDLSRHRRPGALDLHRDLQMDLSRP